MRAMARDTVARETVREMEQPWISLPEKVALSWSMATGIITGGVWVAVNDQIVSSGFLVIMTVLFAAGAVLGYVHGGALGMLGRPAAMGRGEAVRRLLRSALYEIPALGAAWLVAAWVGLTGATGPGGSLTVSAGVAIAWAAAVFICLWAAVEGWQALHNAYERWPHYRIGTAVLITTFGVLAVAFVRARPAIWWTELHVTALGAVILALGATVWLVSPVVIVALQLARRRSA
ncbi:MAG: hypothetical protein WEB88_15435 [Gemmatimonadota bacterium]